MKRESWKPPTMPEHFRWSLRCLNCPAAMEADGHNSTSYMNTWLSGHIEAFGHTKYTLKIILDK